MRDGIQTALALILRGCAQVISEGELRDRLAEGRPLRIKYGADPSAPDLHLGHVVILRKLRQFQDLGHTIQFLIGDFTGRIGDPTGRNATRPPLTPEQVSTNAETYEKQVFRLLDPVRTEVVFNSAWCSAMDDFAARYRAGRPIGLHELLYPLIQGYDSVVLKSDVEMCGTDQIFNCLVARTLQQDAGQAPEIILAMPLLEGLDGVQKMSKSLGNYVGVTDAPNDMFGKLMSLPDTLMGKYYQLLTDLEPGTVQTILDDLEAGRLHPRRAKVDLAKNIVAQFHDNCAAEEAAREFDRVFREGTAPSDMPAVRLSAEELEDGKIWIIKLLRRSGLVASGKEAQRLINQGAVEFDKERIHSQDVHVTVASGGVLQIGKRRFVKILVS